MNKLSNIFLSKKFYKDENKILIRFSYNQKLIALVKSISNVRWSKSLKAWYLTNSDENLTTIHTIFEDTANINQDKLDKKLETKPSNKRNFNQTQKDLLNGFYKYLRGKIY